MTTRTDFFESIRVGQPSITRGRVYQEHLFTNAALQADVADGRILVTLGRSEEIAVNLDMVAGVVESIAVEDGRVKVGWKTMETPSGKIVDEMLSRGVGFVVGSQGSGIVDEDGIVSDFTLHSVSLVAPAG